MVPLLFVLWTALAATRDLATIVPPLSDAQAALTTIVVADIDRDGDADVVATDGALHLFVWINDGAGHLVPQRPAARPELHRERNRPGVEPDAGGEDVYGSIDPPAPDIGSAPSETAAVTSTNAACRTAARPFDRPHGVCPQRGPPARSPSV